MSTYKKLHNKVSRFLNKVKKFHTYFGLILLPILLISLFFITKTSTPNTSELNYVEHSTLGNAIGSVVPASCDTNTPHDGEVCGVWQVTGSCPAWYLCNQAPASLAYACQGSNTSPGCISPQPANQPCASYTCAPTVYISFDGPQTALPVTINSFTTPNTTVSAGTQSTLSWNASNASACYLETIQSGTTLSGYVQPLIGSYTPPQYSGSSDRTRTYKLSCANGSLASIVSQSITVTYEASYGTGDGGCFTAGTKVLLGDGTTKNIEDVTEYDTLMTSGGPELVMKRYHIPYTGLLYAFNGDGNYFVTPTHPFMTTEGWKSLDPEGTRRESPGIVVSRLTIGDTLILHDYQTKILTQLDSKEASTMVYNFGINGTHDFYADNYLVHNVNLGLIEHVSALMQLK